MHIKKRERTRQWWWATTRFFGEIRIIKHDGYFGQNDILKF